MKTRVLQLACFLRVPVSLDNIQQSKSAKGNRKARFPLDGIAEK